MKVKYKLEVMTTKQIRARLQEKAATEWKLHPEMLVKKIPLIIVVGKGQATVLGNASKTVFPDNSVQGILLLSTANNTRESLGLCLV